MEKIIQRGNMYAKQERLFLMFLAQAELKQANVILRHLTLAQYRALKEVSYNLLRGAIELTDDQVTNLRKHRQVYRQLAQGKKQKLSARAIVLLLQVAETTLEKL